MCLGEAEPCAQPLLPEHVIQRLLRQGRGRQRGRGEKPPCVTDAWTSVVLRGRGRLAAGDVGGIFLARAAPGLGTCLHGRSGAAAGPHESGHVSASSLLARGHSCPPPNHQDCHLLPGIWYCTGHSVGPGGVGSGKVG